MKANPKSVLTLVAAMCIPILVIAAIIKGCSRTPQPPVVSGPLQPPRIGGLAPPNQGIEWKPEDGAALSVVQDMFKKQKYGDVVSFADQHPSLPGAQALKAYAVSKSQSSPAERPMTVPLDVYLDIGKMEHLRDLALGLRDADHVPTQAVTGLLADPDPYTKILAMALLCVRNDPHAADFIRPYAGSQDWLLNATAAFALAELGDPSAPELLKKYAQGDSGVPAELAPLVKKAAEYAFIMLKMPTLTSAAEKEAALQRSNQLFRELAQAHDRMREQYRPQVEQLLQL